MYPSDRQMYTQGCMHPRLGTSALELRKTSCCVDGNNRNNEFAAAKKEKIKFPGFRARKCKSTCPKRLMGDLYICDCS